MTARILNLFEMLKQLFSTLFISPDWRDWIDVALLSILIYHALKLLKGTRAKTVFKGIAAIIFVAMLSSYLQLHAISWALKLVFNVGIVSLVILFQPELRALLDKIGRSYLTNPVFNSSRRKQARESERLVSEIARALLNMARKKIGALIVFERQQSLETYAESGTLIDSEISSALIENIFVPNTPLHDGAVIIRDNRIHAAACILTLSDDISISRELGTRHRAGIGVTEVTDCVTFIVSEETGTISMAKEGQLMRYLDANSLSVLLKELFPVEAQPISKDESAKEDEQ